MVGMGNGRAGRERLGKRRIREGYGKERYGWGMEVVHRRIWGKEG